MRSSSGRIRSKPTQDSSSARPRPADRGAGPGNPDAKKRSLLWFAGLAAVLLVLLHEALVGGKGLVPADGIFMYPPWSGVAGVNPSNHLLADQFGNFIPQHEFVQNQIMQGIFPLWNPHLACGMPNLAAIQGALLFPIQLLLSPIDPFYASGLAAFAKLFLAGVFMMLYLRLLGASQVAAFLSGMVFSLSGFMIVWLGHPHVNCAMWLPLLFYFIERQFQCMSGNSAGRGTAPALRNAVGLAVAYGFMLLGGHLPTAVHITISMVAYFLFRLAWQRGGRRFRCAGLLACSLVAGALLAAPQLLPYLEYYRESSSSIASANLHRWSSHLTPNTLICFLLPYISGSPAAGFEDLGQSLEMGGDVNFQERTGYFGIVALFLALSALVFRRCRFTWFYWAITVFSLLVIYGVPPLPMIVHALPVLNGINHTRLLLFAGFSVAVLAGLGLDSLKRATDWRKTLPIVGGFWAAVGVALFLFWRAAGTRLQGLDQLHNAFLYRQFLILAGGLAAAGILSLMMRPARWRRWLVGTVCLGWTAFELLWFGMGHNPAISRELYYPPTNAIAWLQKDPSIFRILGGGDVLVPNTAAIYNLNDARGYDFITLRRYEEFITGKAGDFFFYAQAPSLPPGLQLLNVKYLLLKKPMALDPVRFELVYSGEAFIYRNKNFQERILPVFDYRVERDPARILAQVRSPGFDPARTLLLEEEPERVESGAASADPHATARIASFESNQVVIEASLPRPGFLLLLDTYYPGWSAYVNGRQTRIYRANYNFRAVSLPAGKSTVRFSYLPNSLLLGLALSLATILLLVAAWFWPQRAR
jgi:hypothetical protein